MKLFVPEGLLKPVEPVGGGARLDPGATKPLFASAGNYEAFETDVWQKVHGEWKIISLHYSEITSE